MSPAQTESLISCDKEIFRRDLNKRSFEISHKLEGHPLFKIESLIELAQRVAARPNPHRRYGDLHYDQGSVDLDKPQTQLKRPPATVAEVMRQIEHSQAWILLAHVEREPGYKEVLETCICDLLELSGKQLMRKIKWFDAIVFVTSPRRVTAYHMDRECAWLLQIHGDKDIHLFDKSDPEVVPQQDAEKFWTVDNGLPKYNPDLECRAKVYKMRPGDGVHIPVNAPHWLENKDEVSVSMNVNFQFHDSVFGNIQKANYYLRQSGLNPAPPGKNRLGDAVKGLGYTFVQELNSLRKGERLIPPEAKEQYERIRLLMESRS